VQALLTYLRDLQQNGYLDDIRETDSDIMRLLRTKTKLPVKVILVADRVALQVMLHGSLPYADYPMFRSILMQSQLGNMDLCGPTSKTEESWDESWNQGIDHAASRKYRPAEQKTGGVGGFTADTSMSDSLHQFLIRTIGQLVSKVGEILDACSGKDGAERVLDRVVKWWRRLGIKTYISGEDSQTLSCTVLHACRWLRQSEQLFRETSAGQSVGIVPAGNRATVLGCSDCVRLHAHPEQLHTQRMLARSRKQCVYAHSGCA
jgi:hypothetical protein